MCSELKKLNVLIAEDDIYEREMLCEFISKLKEVRHVDSACDGSQAIKYLNSEIYDLIILDFVMQNTDGLEVLKFLNSMNLKNRPKSIMISAVGKSEIIKKVFDVGLDYYLKKSFNFEYLKEIIYDLCGKNSSSQINNSINSTVLKLGVPANLFGFKYICEVLSIIKSGNVTISEAYRKVARKNFTSCECIETNIRNAVKSAHKSCGEFYSKIFNISANDKKPKNSIFLHTIANIIE